MEAERPKVLIAAPAAVVRELGGALGDSVEVIGGGTWDDAVSLLSGSTVDCVIVCYAFDEVRPFRLLHFLRDEWEREHVPTVLVRALPVPLGKTQEDEIRETYRMLGVDHFLNLHGEATRVGREAALRGFRDSVYALLRLTA